MKTTYKIGEPVKVLIPFTYGEIIGVFQIPIPVAEGDKRPSTYKGGGVEIDSKHMIDLLKLVENKKITDSVASKILEKLIEKPFDVKEYVKKEKLESVSDVSELEKYCKEAIQENPQAVDDYKKGEKKALNFLVGKVMKKTKGKATPKEVNEIILRLIKEK